MDEFENDIKVAISRIKRVELKAQLRAHEQSSFEAETAEAFKRQERARLKASLMKHEESTAEQIKPNVFLGYWKYAAAACILIFSGLFLYNYYKTGNANELAKIKSEKAKKESESKRLLFAATVRKIESTANGELPSNVQNLGVIDPNQMGFASTKSFKINTIDLQAKINELSLLKNGSEEINRLITHKMDSLNALHLNYSFQNNAITIYVSNKIKLDIYVIDNKSYLKINNKIYSLVESKKLRPLVIVTNTNIINQIP
jgi:hypothetical protein